MTAVPQYHTHSSRKAMQKLAWQIFADWAFKFTYESKPRLNGDKLTIANLINKPLWYYMDICSLRLCWCFSLKYDAFSPRGFKISAKLQLSLSNVFSINAKSIGSKQRLSVFTLWGKTGVSTHSCWTVDLPSHQAPRPKAQHPAQSRPHPSNQVQIWLRNVPSNPRFKVRGRRLQSLCLRGIALETRNLGSVKVAGKVLIVDHMWWSVKLLILMDSVTDWRCG